MSLRLIVITGLPGTGKSTLARQIARRYRLPLIAKDAIKEPLMDALVNEAVPSRELSDAAFAVMLAVAAQLLADGLDAILEGNFRAGEHEVQLLAALPRAPVLITQILCRLPEPERLARLAARQSDPARHPGHLAAHQAAREAACDAFLELPGERLIFDGRCEREAGHALRASLDAVLPVRDFHAPAG